MNYKWNVMISRLLWQFLIHVIPVHSYTTEVTIPVSSPIKLECDDDLKVNNIEVAIRRSNISCRTTPEECTLPVHTIDSIKYKCNKQESCEIDIRDTTDVNNCLNAYGFINVWYTCKNILDFSCDFESDLCNWSPKHDEKRFRWEHGNRINVSYNPPVDHTSASPTGKFVYIYADGSTNGDVAYLESEPIIATNQQCLSFWFFTTNSRDSIYVYQNKKTLIDLSNYDKDEWHHKQISLEKSDNFYKLVFEVIRGNKWSYHFGAIVIDDILIENQHCNSSIFQCDFDMYSCYWNGQYQQKYEWVQQHGHGWRYYPGPRYDHSTASDDGYYMYLKKKYSDELTAEITTVYLELPKVDIKILVNSCFTFWYYIHGDGMGGLNITLDNEFAWTKLGNQDEKWNKGMIDLYKGRLTNIAFIGIVEHSWIGDIAIDDLYITDGTCEGLYDHEETCVHLEEGIRRETVCPKGFLDFKNQRLSFDPEKMECSQIYIQTKMRILQECEYRNSSQKCLIDLSNDMSSNPECFQVYEFRILHTCEEEKNTTVSSDSTLGGDLSTVVETSTVSSFSTSRKGSSAAENDTVPRLIENSFDSETGLAVGLVIGALLLVCAVIVIIILIRRHTSKSNPREKIRNNLGGNDYIGSQDIALPLTANNSRHVQNTGIYNGSSDTSLHGHDSSNVHAHNNSVQHEYTNLGAAKGFVNDEKAQVPKYAHRQNKTFADNHMSNDDEYAIVDPTAEISFNETTDNRTGTADSYMVLDPTQTGFNRQIFSNTPVGYEFAMPIKDTQKNNGDEDQYAISNGVYDHSGNNRHKESENNIYNHAVDTIYDSGNHKRNKKGTEDTYDHFFGQQTEDDYDISTTT